MVTLILAVKSQSRSSISTNLQILSLHFAVKISLENQFKDSSAVAIWAQQEPAKKKLLFQKLLR